MMLCTICGGTLDVPQGFPIEPSGAMAAMAAAQAGQVGQPQAMAFFWSTGKNDRYTTRYIVLLCCSSSRLDVIFRISVLGCFRDRVFLMT